MFNGIHVTPGVDRHVSNRGRPSYHPNQHIVITKEYHSTTSVIAHTMTRCCWRGFMSAVLPAQPKPTPSAVPSRNRTSFPAAGKSWGERSIIERNEGMKVFLVDDSVIVLEKLAAMIAGIGGVEIAGQALGADCFFDKVINKVTEIEKIYDTFKQ